MAASVQSLFDKQDVPTQFQALGYTDPLKATYHRLGADYKFVPPPEVELKDDEKKMERKIDIGKKTGKTNTLDAWLKKTPTQ